LYASFSYFQFNGIPITGSGKGSQKTKKLGDFHSFTFTNEGWQNKTALQIRDP